MNSRFEFILLTPAHEPLEGTVSVFPKCSCWRLSGL